MGGVLVANAGPRKRDCPPVLARWAWPGALVNWTLPAFRVMDGAMEKPPRNRGGDARDARARPPRAERLKAALRANLARRKDQARRRASEETGGDDGTGGAGDPERGDDV